MLRALKSLLGSGGPGEPGAEPRREAALVALSVAALGREDLGSLLDAAAEQVAAVVGVDHVDLLGWTPDRDGLVLRASRGWEGKRSSQATVEQPGSLAHVVAESGSALAIADLAGAAAAGLQLPRRVVRSGALVSAVGAPLRSGPEAESHGALIVYGPAPLDGSVASFLEAAARIVAAAIAQRRRNAGLQRSEQRLRELLAGAPDGMISVDAEGRVVAFNAAAEAITGLSASAVMGSSWHEFPALRALPLDPVDVTRDKEEEAGRESVEVCLDTPDGRALWVEPKVARAVLSDGSPVTQVTLRDVSRRKQAERERSELEQHLAQARRLEAIGRLAGGVAHDFNNVLTVILTTSSLLLRDEELSFQGREDIEEICRAADRAAALTRQLLTFSRQQQMEVGAVSLGRVVGDLEDMLDRLIGEHIALQVDLDLEHTSVLGDAGQLEQLVVNLVLNARDALPSGGHIRVETARVRVGEGEVVGVGSGEWIRLTVEDDGIGMDPETRARIFEPFFSRKPREQGTGLGLATVQAIVSQGGGHVVVDTAPGRGSRFDVYLAPSDAVQQEPAFRPLSAPRGFGETVLLVEDERPILEGTRRLLERAGYVVLAAGDAAEAMALWEQSPAVDVLVTDVVMPVETGVSLLRRLRERLPLLPAVFVSGYADDVLDNDPAPPDVVFLDKPFLSEELLDAIREVLDVEGTLDETPGAHPSAGRAAGDDEVGDNGEVI